MPTNSLKRFCARALVAGVLLAPAVALLGIGCSGEQERTAVRGEPMILFAIDGLEWRVMEPLLEAGKLPVMAGLMKEGSFGYLSSMEPTFSSVIWTSIATGKTLDKHGIRHFVYETKRGGRSEYRYYTSGHRETKAFWNILSDYGLTVHCIGWWMTFPAEAINGTMVSQTNTTSVLRDPQRALWKGSLLRGVEDQVYPLDYQNRVMDILEDTERSIDDLTTRIFGEFQNTPDEFSQLMWDQTLWAFRADATYLRVAEDILGTGDSFDLLTVYVGGPDVAGHRFWRYAYPEQFDDPPTPDQLENFGSLIDDYYVYVDEEIGKLLELAPEDVTILIVSDHGMHSMNEARVFDPDDPPQHTNSGHHLDAPPGVFIAAGKHVNDRRITDEAIRRLDLTRLPTVGGVLDVAPTMLALKGIPIGEDFDGSPLRSVIEVSWLEETPITYTKTHDTKEWLQARDERIREAVAQSERLEQLRSLGYIR